MTRVPTAPIPIGGVYVSIRPDYAADLCDLCKKPFGSDGGALCLVFGRENQHRYLCRRCVRLVQLHARELG